MIAEMEGERAAVHLRGAPHSTWAGRIEHTHPLGVTLRTRRPDGNGGWDYTTHVIPWTSVARVELLKPAPDETPWP